MVFGGVRLEVGDLLALAAGREEVSEEDSLAVGDAVALDDGVAEAVSVDDAVPEGEGVAVGAELLVEVFDAVDEEVSDEVLDIVWVAVSEAVPVIVMDGD